MSLLTGNRHAIAVKLLRRYLLVFYWLTFACYTLVAAKEPGYTYPREMRWAGPYPWGGVIFVWIVLAAFTWGIFKVLTLTLTRPWRRLGYALLYVSLLLMICVFLFGFTDQPGWYYVPLYFSLFTFVGMVVYALAFAIAWLWKRYRGAF